MRGTGRPTALVVEDDHDLGPCIHEILDEGGYSTTLVRSVEGAREALDAGQYDVVVLDVMLGAGHARELLAEVGARVTAPPTLLVSAAREAPSLAEQYGISLVPKPFDLDEFLDRVSAARSAGQRPRTPVPPPAF